MADLDKRIPVTEDRWRKLNDIKDAGQTYDELLEELITDYHRSQLAKKARAAREAEEGELTPLDKL